MKFPDYRVDPNALMAYRTTPTVVVVMAVVVLLVTSCYQRETMDSVAARRRVNKELQALTERIKRDSNDTVAFELLVAALRDEYPYKRIRAATCLRSLGSKAKAAVPDLAKALKDSDQTVRREAALALGVMGPDAKEAVPNLAAALKEDNDDVTWFAAQALGSIGPAATSAVPSLVEALDVYDLNPRASSSLGPQLAFEAADALAKLGPHAKEALPALKAHLRIPSPDYKIHLAHAMRRIDASDAESLQALTTLLQSDRVEIRRRSLSALGDLGRDAQPAAPAVKAYLSRQQSEEDRQAALFILRKIEGSDQSN